MAGGDATKIFPSRSAAKLRAHGMDCFEVGDLTAARSALTAAMRRGAHDPDLLALLAGLTADAGDPGETAGFYAELIDRFGPIVRPQVVLEWERERFDALIVAGQTLTPETRADAALDLLAAAATAGDWGAVLARRKALESLFATPARRLDLLEQFAYAPAETGLPDSAAAEIGAIGHRYAGDVALPRLAERLLHGTGHRDAAYAVERARRAAARTAVPRTAATDDSEDFAGIVVLIAGGHPPLRRMVTVDLKRSGASGVREIPSKWESVRAGRQVRDRMAGSDLAVLIGRQLAHSTADQVRSAAASYGVPVVRAETAGVDSIHRAALGARR